MPKLKLNIPHNLTQTEALTHIQKFLPSLRVQHSNKIRDIEESWNGNTGAFKFKISGFKVFGILQVEESAVIIKGDIPFRVLLFK